ncbi:hypothetical protein COBT_002138 [Conglomerata obtusa]
MNKLKEIRITQTTFESINKLKKIMLTNDSYFIQIVTNESFTTIIDLLNTNIKLLFSSQSVRLNEESIYLVVDDGKLRNKLKKSKVLFYSKNMFTDHVKYILKFTNDEKANYLTNIYGKEAVNSVIPYLGSKNLFELKNIILCRLNNIYVEISEDECFLVFAVYKHKKLIEAVKLLTVIDKKYQNYFLCKMIVNELLSKKILKCSNENYLVNVSRESLNYILQKINFDLYMLEK